MYLSKHTRAHTRAHCVRACLLREEEEEEGCFEVAKQIENKGACKFTHTVS